MNICVADAERNHQLTPEMFGQQLWKFSVYNNNSALWQASRDTSKNDFIQTLTKEKLRSKERIKLVIIIKFFEVRLTVISQPLGDNPFSHLLMHSKFLADC